MTKAKAKILPTILVTNDDSINAPGIKALVNGIKHLGNVVVVAPDKPQSGMGHAITIGQFLRLEKVHFMEGVEAYTCSGTPADCVKLAVDKVLHKKPTICLSGINHGANHSINVIYSGTMSAAIEAAIENIPSAGISLMNYSMDADFSLAQKIAGEIAEYLLYTKLPPNSVFNVNVPAITEKKYKGIKLCRQANAKYVEDFDERNDPMGKKYYWLTGAFKNFDKGADTDVWALKNNYASLVPVQYDLTNYTLKNIIEKTWITK